MKLWNIIKCYLPLCVVFDSASATPVRDFFDWLFSSGDEVVSIRSCLITGLMSSPSSRLDDVNGDDDALLLGVEEAAPSTHKSPGAGNLGDAGGGVWTLVPLPEAFFPDIGADMLGLLVFMVDSGRASSSLSLSLSDAVKQWPPAKFSLLQDATLCWMKRTMSDRAKGFWQTPHVKMSWWPSGSAPSASAATIINHWRFYFRHTLRINVI